MTRAIDRLAGMVAEAGDRDIPSSVLARAGDCVLDALSSAAAGLSAASTRAMRRAMPLCGGTAPVWFTDRTGDPITAATLNAMAATALDIDDGHRQAAGHPGAAVVASALAGARPELSGRELLAAVVLGYEVSVRVALARMPEHHKSTVSGRWSGTGAAAAMAKLQGLAPDVIARSILIAEQHAPRVGSAQSHGFAGSDVKEGIAWSVLSGLQAVELAKAGFRGYPDSFDQGVLYDPQV
ncbi:MAG: MmgE/PrpD family protein, partial [Geminicoccaceae bacterium]